MMNLEKYKPSVMNSFLLLMAGVVWVGVGIMLLCITLSWLSLASNAHRYLIAGIGVVLALLVHHFGFLRIVDTNLKRILQTDDKKRNPEIAPDTSDGSLYRYHTKVKTDLLGQRFNS